MKIKSKQFVIQKYIEQPLLYKKKKFDIRLFILVSQSGKLYVFRESYIRVSAYEYSLDDMQKFGHLNNIAIQKYSKDYDQEKAIISVKELERYINQTKDPHFNFEVHIRPKLNQIVAIMGALLMQKFTVSSRSNKNNFEIFGLDFMIDQFFKVWLIEANTNPAITTNNSFLDQLIPRMLDDAFKLTLDKVFPIPKKSTTVLSKHFWRDTTVDQIVSEYEQSAFKLCTYSDSDNLWDRVTNTDIERALKCNPN